MNRFFTLIDLLHKSKKIEVRRFFDPTILGVRQLIGKGDFLSKLARLAV